MSECVLLNDEAWNARECEENRGHYMGIVNSLNGATWSVFNDDYFFEDKDTDGFISFDFCPNCGKELKEFYQLQSEE